ncbi:MAG: acyl-CoA dehydrogenase family protein, partial [Solirubrobacterales bacterium]|nr:acyl-CoA dehydrogenase family protein [Solirubrobacterales bacterium]
MVSADLDTPPRLKSHSEARQAAERYAEGLRPGVIERDRAGADRIPHQELAAFDRSGLLALTIPEEHGGSGLGPSTLAEVTQIIAAVDPAIAQGPQGHYLFLDVILALGNEQQKQRLLGDVLAGKRIANALAERGGANAQDLKTRISGAPLAGAEPTASTGPITLNGKKYYTTGSLTAHRIAVSALDAEDRLLIAFVERDQPGVKLDTDWDVMGQRATVSGSITFEDVELDPA